MTINLDGKEYDVGIVDEMAEDVTMRQIKEKLAEKITALEEFMKQAESLGIVFDNSGGMVSATDKKTPTPKPADATVINEAKPNEAESSEVAKSLHAEGRKRVDTTLTKTKADGTEIRTPQKTFARDMQTIEVQTAKSTGENKATVTGTVPIAIPRKTVGNTGTTIYRIKKVTDADLQARFKDQATSSTASKGLDINNKNYGSLTCHGCGGQGSVLKGNEPIACKVCNGNGQVT